MREYLKIRTAVLLLAPLAGLATVSEAAPEWSDIEVEVQADRRDTFALPSQKLQPRSTRQPSCSCPDN